jgi:hypothetical protein
LIRVDKKHPCPICNHGKYCAFSNDGLYVACKRVKEGSITDLGQFGFLHQLKEREDLTGYAKQTKPYVDWKKLQYTYQNQLSAYGKYPTLVGIDNPNTYREYFCGSVGTGWSFPMFNASLQITGIQVRYPDGTKCCVTGSTQGVFLPKNILSVAGKLLTITEGVSDAMAAHELGMVAIGRYNCDGPDEIVTQLVIEKIKPSKILIFVDNDPHEAGLKGSKNLCEYLRTYLPGMHIKLVKPPAPHKDLRSWISVGGLTQDNFINKIKESLC